MDIFAGHLILHAILFPEIVEGHLKIADAAGQPSGFMLTIEKRPWNEWKSWLSASVSEATLSVAEATLRQGEDWHCEKIALKLPHKLTQPDVTPATPKTVPS